MAVWERARVLALASDAGSAAAGARLAVPRPWSMLGRTDRCVWGLCQGSGQQPYRTAVDLSDGAAGGSVAYSCTCPSRKQPCKHALGLLLLWSAGGVAAGDSEPGFAADWLRGRDERAARKRTTDGPDVPDGQASGGATREVADPEAAARRVAARRERVSLGLDDLERWLHDQVRGGLAGLEGTGHAAFEQVAARLVDAQAPGVAGLLRSAPADLSGDGWPARVLHRLAAVHLLVQAHRRLDDLPVELAETVRSRVGYPVGRSDVLARPGVADRWLALGLVDTVESQLESRRVWLYGTRTGRWGLLLSFAATGQSLDDTVRPGQRMDAELHFYPGAGLRALVGRPVPDLGSTEVAMSDPSAATGVPVGETCGQLQGRFAELLARDPWATRMPAVLAGAPVPPGPGRAAWSLRDTDGGYRPLLGLSREPWPLLARSAGEPVSVCGEWEDAGFRPLSVLPDRYGPFSTAVAA